MIEKLISHESSFEVLSWNVLEGTDENHENLTQDSWSLGRDLQPLQYEPEVPIGV
jgi:hypothetical protein